jgi:hypothetical protein
VACGGGRAPEAGEDGADEDGKEADSADEDGKEADARRSPRGQGRPWDAAVRVEASMFRGPTVEDRHGGG